MSTPTLQAEPGATSRAATAADPFVQRCGELGVALWRCDATGRILAEPIGPAPLLPWLRCVHVRERVAVLAASVAGRKEKAAVELIAGCRLIPLVNARALRAEPFDLLLTAEPDAVRAAELNDTCRAAGLDPSSVFAGLRDIGSAAGEDGKRVLTLLDWMRGDLARAERDDRTMGEFSEKLVQAYEETNLLFRLARLANFVHEPEQLMHTFCQQLHMILPFAWVAVRFNTEANGVPVLAGRLILAGDLPCDGKEFDVLLADRVSKWKADGWTRLLEPTSDPLARLTGAELIIDPVTHDGRVIGAILAGNKRGNDSDLSSVETQFIDAAADFLGVFHENLARFLEQRALFLGTLQSLTASIDAKDPYTCGHSERVALLASQVATAMGLDAQAVEHYRIAGLVHDVGKIGVPEAVLCKTARLTDEEFAIIKKHPETGHRILKDIPLMEVELPGVLHHHERWDGRGYPHGLKGEGIPTIARVLALADTFDAMSSNRAYRAALPREKVLAEFHRCAGSQFDPALVPIFLAQSFDAYDQMLAHHRANASSS